MLIFTPSPTICTKSVMSKTNQTKKAAGEKSRRSLQYGKKVAGFYRVRLAQELIDRAEAKRKEKDLSKTVFIETVLKFYLENA